MQSPPNVFVRKGGTGRMYLIVGLGNPGQQYAHTRHNVGFDVMAVLEKKLGVTISREKGYSQTADCFVDGQKVILALPQTYMNLSGLAVRELMDYYKIPPENVLVIYDDIDIPQGTVRIRPNGSAGTHNGMRSIVAETGTEDFPRIRVGVGQRGLGWNLADWVLSHYQTAEEQEIADKAWERIQEVEKLGGMAKAIETGIPKMRIEEASARKQARIDSGEEKIIGINEYRLEKEAPIDILAVDNTAVRESQIKRLKELRANRDEAAVKKALAAITECVKTKQGNLLELAVEAAKVRASLGEISDACEVVVGRYKAVIRSISGVYSSEVKNDKSFERAKELCAEFAKKEGRQPRVMIAKLGQDGHDRGAKVVATGYADIGFDVDMGPLFQTPEEAAKQAVENDVHVVGVSSLAAGHLTLVPQIIAELKKLGREDIIVIVGGVIPAQDYDELYRDGAAAIFGPGTPISTAAIKILEILLAE